MRRQPTRRWIKDYGTNNEKRRMQAARLVYPVSEPKYFDTGKLDASISVANTWAGSEVDPTTFNTLCVPIKGSGINQRIGRRIAVKKIKIRGFIIVPGQSSQSTADAAQYFRLVLFMDKQTNGTQAQGEEVFADPQVAANGNACLTFQSLNNFGRFEVLKDEVKTISNLNMTGPAASIVTAGYMVPFKMTKTFRDPVAVHFNETNGGTVADIVDNSFHLLAKTSSVGMNASLSYEARVVYKDI